jgi:hypothetical protein
MGCDRTFTQGYSSGVNIMGVRSGFADRLKPDSGAVAQMDRAIAS